MLSLCYIFLSYCFYLSCSTASNFTPTPFFPPTLFVSVKPPVIHDFFIYHSFHPHQVLDNFFNLPSLSEVSLFHSSLSPQINFMAVTLDFSSFPVQAPPRLHPFYCFCIVSSIKRGPSHFSLSFSFCLLSIFSLVLWFQLKAFYFHCIPYKSLPNHLSLWLKSPMSPFCVHSSFSSAYNQDYSFALSFISHILESLMLCSSLLNNDHIPCTLILEVIFSLKLCQSILPQFSDDQ